MKNKSKILTLTGIMMAACLALSGCGSTIGTNLKSYTSNVSKIVSGMSSSSTTQNAASSGTSSESTAIALDIPTDFSIADDGSYSFSGVDNASYYLIYFCEPDATDDGADYLYTSNPIYDNGSGTYTGNVNDEFRFAYGEYLAKVYAFPELTDSSLKMSGAIMTSYTFSGAQDDPEIDYFWDNNNMEMEIDLANVETYAYQAYPDEVKITFANVDDPSDIVEASIEKVNADNSSVIVSGLKKGAEYEISAVSLSNSEFVTNPESDTVIVEDALELGDVNILSPNYIWSDGWADFPRLIEDFDLTAGGNAGTVYGKFRDMEAATEATPTSASSGSDYSYTIFVDFGGVTLSGTLELKSDGTLIYEEGGGGPVSAGSIDGNWVDNGDGTATLSYVPTDITS